MEISTLYNQLKELKKEQRKVIYTSKDGTQVTATHTGKISPHDFAVGLVISGQREFYPTHIRLLVDLYIKRESNPEGAKRLLEAFERVYKGEDPLLIKNNIKTLKFPMKFDSPETNLYCAQLFFIEQDLNYGPDGSKKSKLNPPREYTMRFIRWVLSGDNQIDRIIFAAAGRRYPAPTRYAKPLTHDKQGTAEL